MAETLIDPDEIFDGTEKYPILFASNAGGIGFKGVGSVSEWAASQTLYIYGIKRDAADVLDLAEGIQIDNVAAAAPSGGTSSAITVYEYPDAQIPYYYDNGARYDFFGYYVDDAFVPGEEDPVVSEADITLPVCIDGTQDIMLGYADRDSAVFGTTIPASRLYSAYAVRKGIQPDLRFEHQLSRLVFKVRKGADQDSSVDSLFIKDLTVTSPANGILTIVGENRGLQALDLTEEEIFPLASSADSLLVEGSSAIQLDGSVMVMPGKDTYELIPISGGAQPDKSYTITLTVYNLESVNISVSLVAWDEETEEIFIGEDED